MALGHVRIGVLKALKASPFICGAYRSAMAIRRERVRPICGGFGLWA